MFDGFLMSITNKLKKISASLDLYEGKFDEISTDVGNVNTAVSSVETKVDTVQTTSDEIKSLISSEVTSAKNEILTELSGGSSGSEQYVCAASSTVLKNLVSSAVNANDGYDETIASVRIVGFSGTIRVSCSLKNEDRYYSYLKAIVNGNEHYTVSVQGTTYKTVTTDVRVADGDYLEFIIYSGNSARAAYCQSLSICGTITKTSNIPGYSIISI